MHCTDICRVVFLSIGSTHHICSYAVRWFATPGCDASLLSSKDINIPNKWCQDRVSAWSLWIRSKHHVCLQFKQCVTTCSLMCACIRHLRLKPQDEANYIQLQCRRDVSGGCWLSCYTANLYLHLQPNSTIWKMPTFLSLFLLKYILNKQSL